MKVFKQTLILNLLLLIACFVKADTVDNYQIRIKGKLIMNDSGLNGGGLFYTFHKANFTDTLEISFNHCMSGADRRIIKLFDKLNNIISQWSFVDKQVLSPMSIPISQLLGHIKVKGELSLVYFDDILPEGRFLLTINSK